MIRIMNLGIVLIVFGTGIFCCAESRFTEEKGKAAVQEKTIGEALKEHSPELMSIPGVVGTAQGLCSGRPCIIVYVVKKSPELNNKIPDTLEGYPVRIEETGEFRALPENRD